MEYIYAALLLHKLGKPVDEAHLKKVVSASGAEVDESKVKALVASLHGVDIDKELENAVLVASSGAPSGKATEEKKEEKKEEKAEAAAEGLSSLFG
ncbi:50S ribosomal protein P1 [Candidatus Pacearchaeota archaeon CG10_big_fil_rev_8_21_14_0_10_31_9]|nr:MAG: 50S ribosomal protein P1 [Candidatus Pacearchaeota archaeon CG1_02_32_21]PIN94240.1 MAG: 50S ribosomal protein P1 [Candidatus Pacearchaeota archaeon CG10_big_fil_rev_8_21_14_0_10_31_9]PIZ82977.1 MAG: 50S ribosomal protein P1 [Candidatus Pacearchaeota archaeon CG_4_10_14_0_2_um_filter_05_32_18]